MKKILALLMICVISVFSSLPVLAAEAATNSENFTPSVTEKHAPTVVEDTDGDYGKAYDSANSIVYNLKKEDVVIVSLNGASEAEGALKDELPAAYQEIKNAQSLSDISADLNTVADKLYPGSSADEFVVSDIFGLDFSEDTKDTNPAYITVTMEVGSYTGRGHTPVVVFKPIGSDEWIVIGEDGITVNDDGTMQVTFPGAGGVVSFLKHSGEIGSGEGTGKHDEECVCPDWCFTCGFLCTENTCWCWIVPVIFVVLVIAVVVIVIIIKRRNDYDYYWRY